MIGDVAQLSVSVATPMFGQCELCAVDPAELTTAVVIRHSHGGMVRFAACDRCTRAVRRLVAAIGEFGTVVTQPQQPVSQSPLAREPPEEKERLLVREEPDALVDTEGTSYTARVYGAHRADGTWAGWIEFEAAGTGMILRTGRETTQSNQQHLAYWAAGLEPTYFQGAFTRAR